MKNLTSLAGWVLLLAVLAVPSFLFYNWWSGNKTKASAEAAQPAVQTEIFSQEKDGRAARPAAQPTPSASAQAPAPVTPVPAQPPAASSAAVHAAAHANPAGSRPPSREEGPIMDQPASAPAPAARPPAQPEAKVSTAAAVSPVAASTGPALVSWYSPKSDRDPTLSPADYSRIRAEERRRLENERAARLAASRRTPEAQIESRLQLQGIVGNAAIINGEMYSAGQSIYGAKILKVGANYVIGEYKGRKFRKVLQ